VDSAVIKDHISNLPYIPGSSMKGKIRCLLETESDNYPGGEKNELLNKLFGINNEFRKANAKEIEKHETPTRLIFRDLNICDSDKAKFESGKYSTEFKTEIVIDRKKGTAKDGGLRTIERIPPEITFEGEILIRYMDEAELKQIMNVLDEAKKMLNNDYLGGSGSRGYGAVEVK
jgi:CRISPR-associated protein Csm3